MRERESERERGRRRELIDEPSVHYIGALQRVQTQLTYLLTKKDVHVVVIHAAIVVVLDTFWKSRVSKSVVHDVHENRALDVVVIDLGTDWRYAFAAIVFC